MKTYKFPYQTLFDSDSHDQEFALDDHLVGFDSALDNKLLLVLQDRARAKNIKYKIHYHQIVDKNILSKYPNLEIIFDPTYHNNVNLNFFHDYRQHPEIVYKNFICSFNGSDHVDRKLLTAILNRFGYFTPDYCSKNFIFTIDKIDGHITDYVGDRNRFYRKFFISDDGNKFFDKIYSFGYVRFDHATNIYNLENKITQSFLHIVGESLATSYVPFVTEKFLYSVVTRGLFLSYAQPGWHEHIEKYHGFKKYTKLFDYRFDSIENPVERLIELMCMISKFSRLSADDWKDLYLLEQDTIEYNYDHYFSKDYLKCLAKYS